MIKINRWFLAASLSLSFLENSTAQENADPILEYSRQSEKLAIQLDYIPEMEFDVDREPHLRIYGDGRVLVHPFSYETRRGVREMHILEQELQNLLRYLYDQGFMEFDTATVKEKKSAVLSERDRESESQGKPKRRRLVSDSSTIVVDVYLDVYRRAEDTGNPRENFHHQIKWHALKQDAEEYPEVTELALLYEIGGRLRAYTEHVDLVKIGEVSEKAANNEVIR